MAPPSRSLTGAARKVDLHLEVDHSGTFMWQLLVSAEQQFATQRDFGAMGEHEADMIKRIFIETNPYFLVPPPPADQPGACATAPCCRTTPMGSDVAVVNWDHRR